MQYLARLVLLLFFIFALSNVVAAPQIKTIAVNGTTITYAEDGQGTPLVLIHGSMLDSRTWAAQVEQFAARYRVIAVSLRHHYPNPSTGDMSDYTRKGHAADIAAMIRALSLGPVHLLGHSFGGAIALMLARDYPDMVRSLVLVEPAAVGLIMQKDQVEAQPFLAANGQAAQKARAELEAGNREAAMRAFHDFTLGAGGYDRAPQALRGYWMENYHILRRFVSMPGEPYTCEDAGKLGVPSLLIGGDSSIRFFALILNGAQSCIKKTERVTIAKAGHQINWDNPTDFNRAVLDFVGRH